MGKYECALKLSQSGVLYKNRDKRSKTAQTVLAGNFLAFLQQTAHRAKYGEAGRKSRCSHRKSEVLFIVIKVIVLVIIILVIQVFGICGVEVKIIFRLKILFLCSLHAFMIS